MTCNASGIGTLLNRLLTLKLASMLEVGILMVFSFFMNYAELVMWESVLLLSGFRILVNSLASWYVCS